MIEARANLLTMVALGILRNWYRSWEQFHAHAHGDVRRGSLVAKAYGLINHDRVLNGEVRHG